MYLNMFIICSVPIIILYFEADDTVQLRLPFKIADFYIFVSLSHNNIEMNCHNPRIYTYLAKGNGKHGENFLICWGEQVSGVYFASNLWLEEGRYIISGLIFEKHPAKWPISQNFMALEYLFMKLFSHKLHNFCSTFGTWLKWCCGNSCNFWTKWNLVFFHTRCVPKSVWFQVEWPYTLCINTNIGDWNRGSGTTLWPGSPRSCGQHTRVTFGPSSKGF